MGDRIPGPRPQVMAGCGHFNTLERLAEFNRILEACIRKIRWEG